MSLPMSAAKCKPARSARVAGGWLAAEPVGHRDEVNATAGPGGVCWCGGSLRCEDIGRPAGQDQPDLATLRYVMPGV
jgi:hypothetical protein